jgi:1-phosphatidylinositol-4-phosphate 5-kinase
LTNVRVPRKYVLRTFDLKGSEFDREVLAKKEIDDLSKVTLKDIDFLKTEEKIWIEQDLAKCILIFSN